MVWEGSVLDANEGIRFHGKSIADCQQVLPKGTTGTEMLPEAMFWLLLTGQVPSTSQIRAFSRELAENSTLPAFVEHMLDSFPKDLHPMTQFACAVSTLNHESVFAKAYEKGINKADYWEPTFDDSISLLAKLPIIAAKIHQNSYKEEGRYQRRLTQNKIGPTISPLCWARAVRRTRTSRTYCGCIWHCMVTTRAAMSQLTLHIWLVAR